MTGYAGDTHDRNGQKPKGHNRAEGLANPSGALRLNRKKSNEDRHRSRQHVGWDGRRRDIQSLERGEYRDGRRDCTIAVNQCRPKKPDCDDDGPLMLFSAQQRHQGKNATFSSLSILMAKATYFTDVMMINVQMISDSTPNTTSLVDV